MSVDVHVPQPLEGQDHWTAFFKLAKLDGDLSTRNVKFDPLLDHDVSGGASNYTIDPAMTEPRMSIDGLPVVFVLRRGDDDQLAGIEIIEVVAGNYSNAINLATAYFNHLNSLLTFIFQLPLRYGSITVHLTDDRTKAYWRLYHPWADAQLQPFKLGIPGAPTISRFVFLYAEGVISNSRPYQFLCFFKIVDHILKRAAALRSVHDGFPSATWIELQDLLPEDPVKFCDADLVGRKYTYARDRYEQTELRNAVAHILPTEKTFEPLDPVHASHYRAAAVVCRIMAHHLIRIVGNNCGAMIEAGAPVGDLLGALFPSTHQ